MWNRYYSLMHCGTRQSLSLPFNQIGLPTLEMDFSRLCKGDFNSHSSSWHTRRCVTEQPTLIKSEWGYYIAAELYSSIDLDVIKREEGKKEN